MGYARHNWDQEWADARLRGLVEAARGGRGGARPGVAEELSEFEQAPPVENKDSSSKDSLVDFLRTIPKLDDDDWAEFWSRPDWQDEQATELA